MKNFWINTKEQFSQHSKEFSLLVLLSVAILLIGLLADVKSLFFSNSNQVYSTSTPAFVVSDKIDKLETSYEKSTYLAKIEGTSVGGNGYIADLYSGNRVLVKDIKYGIFVSYKILICDTDEDSFKEALAIGKNGRILFDGNIDSYGEGFSLKNCKIKQG